MLRDVYKRQPKPRSYAKRMNNKEVKLAMRSALSAKLADGELVLVDDYGLSLIHI